MGDKLKPGQRILVKGYVGPSGLSGDHGVFVRVNTDDPEIWVSVKDVIPVKVGKDKRARKAGGVPEREGRSE